MSTTTAKTSNNPISKMVLEWSMKQGKSMVSHLEKTKAKETLSLHWPMIKGAWLAGFTQGSEAGFSLGFDTAMKFEVGIDKAVPGTDKTVQTDQSKETEQMELGV